MRAARLHAPREPLRLEEVPLPVPQGAEVRVRVAGCGICRTDLHIVDGIQRRVRLPLTLGHEIAGWIDAAGGDARLEAEGLEIGQPVVVAGGWGCGTCAECAAGAEQRCPSGTAPGFQRDGGYADAVLVPHARHLVPLGTLDPVRAGPLADAAATTYRAVRRALPWLLPAARIVVLGGGGLGQFALQHLRLAGGPRMRVALVEPDPQRRELGGSLGADVALPTATPEAVADALGGPATAAFDLVGTDATLAAAAAIVAPDGLIMLVGEAGGRLVAGFDLIPVEAWLTTTAWTSRGDLAEVVELASADRLRWEVELAPLAETNAALDRVRAATPLGRVVLVPGP
jgi:propanol-preferring alcohol dehydrogenase